MESCSNTQVQIQSKPTSDSHKTLGCYKNPEMSSGVQTIELQKNIKNISQLTCSYGLSSDTSRIDSFQVFLPAVQCPLTSLHISRKPLDAVQAKATRRFLTNMGYNPNMPPEVVYAPKQSGGLGFQSLYTTQGVRNTTQLLKHTMSHTTVGKLFKIAVHWLKIWAGLGTHPMATLGGDIHPTSSKYIHSISSFLHKCDASIIMSQRPKILRENDIYIMDHVMRSNLSRGEINMVNTTRVYLQVQTVAEISNPEGTKIEKIWTEEESKLSSSTRNWP